MRVSLVRAECCRFGLSKTTSSAVAEAEDSRGLRTPERARDGTKGTEWVWVSALGRLRGCFSFAQPRKRERRPGKMARWDVVDYRMSGR